MKRVFGERELKGTDAGKRNCFARRILGAVLAVVMALGISLPMAVPSYALGVEFSSDAVFAQQGNSDVEVSVDITNNTGDAILFTGEITVPPSGILASNSGNPSVTVKGGGEKGSLIFKVNVANSAKTKDYEIPVKVSYNGKSEMTKARITVGEKLAAPKTDGGSLAALDMNYSLSNGSSLIAGQPNDLKVTIFNKGNTLLKNAEVSLKLPDSMSINNGAASQSAGYLFIGDSYTVKFPILADTNMENKNYGIDVNVNFKDQGNAAQVISKTIYIPVTGGEGGGDKLDGLAITNVTAPKQVPDDEDFTISFTLENNSQNALKDIKVSMDVPEGTVNKTKNVFVEASLAKGATKNYTVTYNVPNQTGEKSYAFKITAESSVALKEGSTASTISQYASVLVKNAGGKSKTPQLMVENYSFGGSYVQAGKEFRLSMSLYNTSSAHEINNAKITLTADDGIFVPVNSSNAFFFDKIDKKGHVEKTLNFSVKAAAEQKTTSMTVDMTYEDEDGNPFTAKDVIAIPVMQETKLMVDDLVAPPELYMGQPGGANVQFYNMGKTTLSNLKVTVSGDFDSTESNSYFVGNLEAGKSDSFDFSFTPRAAGTMQGAVMFTYEDASGNPQSYEKPFTFQIMDEMPMEDPGMMMPEEPQGKNWKLIGGIGAGVAAIAIVVIVMKIRKKKKDREMVEIDE